MVKKRLEIAHGNSFQNFGNVNNPNGVIKYLDNKVKLHIVYYLRNIYTKWAIVCLLHYFINTSNTYMQIKLKNKIPVLAQYVSYFI